ncbi:RBP1 protein, partial [Ploceus nigricollis]|nr:RBP1 protein [Ploceus nigricollis]
CFLLLTSSPSEHFQVGRNGSLGHTSSCMEEISPTKFPGLNSTIELSPPHDCLYKPPDVVSDDEKEHEKKNGKYKKKKK